MSSTTSTSTSTSTSSTTSTSTTVVSTACTHSDLTLSSGKTGAATGTIFLGFTLTNSSHSACTIDGYPTVVLIGPSGDVDAQVSHSAPGEIFSNSPASVTLEPGVTGSAGFVVAYTDVQSNGQTSCPEVDVIELTMPDENGQFHAARRFYPCGAPSISVSPVVSGATYKSEVAASGT